MKKISTLIAGLLLVFGLSSCSGPEQVLGTYSSPNNDQLIRFSIDGVAYIATFSYNNMTI